jgi:hypothetical protein
MRRTTSAPGSSMTMDTGAFMPGSGDHGEAPGRRARDWHNLQRPNPTAAQKNRKRFNGWSLTFGCGGLQRTERACCTVPNRTVPVGGITSATMRLGSAQIFSRLTQVTRCTLLLND